MTNYLEIAMVVAAARTLIRDTEKTTGAPPRDIRMHPDDIDAICAYVGLAGLSSLCEGTIAKFYGVPIVPEEAAPRLPRRPLTSK